MSALTLRDHQSADVESARAAFRAGNMNVVLVAPTGAGKTIIGAFLLNECNKKFRRAIFVVDRTALIEQTSAVLDSYDIPHGIIQAQHWRFRPYERIQVASIQTLARRQWPADIDLIIIDECHCLHKAVADRIASKTTRTLGLTATPFTRGLGKHYDALVGVTTTNRLIADKFLVPFRIFAASEPDMTSAKVTAGEWSDNEAAARSMPIVGDVVAEYLKLGEGRKFIAFGANVAHCEELQRQFMAAGVVAELYTYRVGDDARSAMVTEFRKPDSYIRGLISVAALSKGFDVSDVGCIIMARPLRSSLAEHIQILGRGLRIHPGKADCIVLDHSGNCVRFWHAMQDFFERGASKLDDGNPREKKPANTKEKQPTKCPKCFHVHDPAPACPACGFSYPAKASGVEYVEGTLAELVASGNQATLSRDVWPQIVGLALEFGKGEKWALSQYKAITGAWPMREFATTEPVPATKQVRGKVKQLFIAWQKRTGRASEGRASA